MIAFATCTTRPDITPDDQLAADVLTRQGHPVVGVPWDAPDIDWSSFDAIIIRSTWNYWSHAAAFYAWLDHLAALSVPVYNPPSVLRWNTDKRYLLDFASQGVRTIPTTLVPQGSSFNLSTYLQTIPRVVIKPTIAAGGYHTFIATGPADQSRFDTMLAAGSLLLQPFLPEIATHGEWSLLFFNNTFSHAVLKHPSPGEFRVQPQHGGSCSAATPPDYLITQAQKILHSLPHPLLYARLDGLDLNNTFTLMELEALEPQLFLSTSPQAPENFARALLSLLRHPL
jgi:glutathione synthase/RimK-type ligase-like ATP-grasp enzyme